MNVVFKKTIILYSCMYLNPHPLLVSPFFGEPLFICKTCDLTKVSAFWGFLLFQMILKVFCTVYFYLKIRPPPTTNCSFFGRLILKISFHNIFFLFNLMLKFTLSHFGRTLPSLHTLHPGIMI